jgi:hypothetical protein
VDIYPNEVFVLFCFNFNDLFGNYLNFNRQFLGGDERRGEKEGRGSEGSYGRGEERDGY